ncbi:hypothetical protein EV385_6738 [Krasilnikovia cinnamomea]|uniref:Uncharacterized protein n=1 Tax=Krasilnikovia cinnamomea TaxID=349313 RepID=A0A4Q7Z9C7_9ACTN|nr:hypothetical protein EV385_6738 [Krasilnikovia cinnamomea]
MSRRVRSAEPPGGSVTRYAAWSSAGRISGGRPTRPAAGRLPPAREAAGVAAGDEPGAASSADGWLSGQIHHAVLAPSTRISTAAACESRYDQCLDGGSADGAGCTFPVAGGAGCVRTLTHRLTPPRATETTERKKLPTLDAWSALSNPSRTKPATPQVNSANPSAASGAHQARRRPTLRAAGGGAGVGSGGESVAESGSEPVTGRDLLSLGRGVSGAKHVDALSVHGARCVRSAGPRYAGQDDPRPSSTPFGGRQPGARVGSWSRSCEALGQQQRALADCNHGFQETNFRA